MGAPTIGEVILVPFPFSDLSQTKVRPAVCLADAGRGDWILCQVTSNPYGDPYAVELDSSDFAAGGLLTKSYARPSKLFASHGGLFIRAVGILNGAALDRILDSVIAIIWPSKP